MSITDHQTSVELLEELLRDHARREPAERVQRLRRRLLGGLRLAELLAGAAAGAAIALIVGTDGLATFAVIAAAALAWFTIGVVSGLAADEDARPWSSTLPKVRTTATAALAASWATLAVLTLLQQPNAGAAGIVAGVIAFAVSLGGRGLTHAIVFRSADLRQRTIIIGSGLVARTVVDRMKLSPRPTLDIIGMVDDDVHHADSPELPLLGSLDRLDEILGRHDVDRAIIAFSRSGHDDLLRCIRVCWDRRVAIDVVPRLFEFLDGARRLEQVGGLPMLSITAPQLSRAARATKRASDVVLSGLMLTALLPMLLLTALLIKLDSRGPVFFRQPRVGRGGELFDIIKFRSMHIDAEERKRDYERLNEASDGVMFKIRADPRITRVGRLLRKSSIDELPQLINVLRGEMSLVGPRPLISQETEAFSEGWHRRRLDLRPGITGPWQVYGRSDIPYDDMLRLDYQYVAGWSLARDVEILFATVPVVVSGRGAY